MARRGLIGVVLAVSTACGSGGESTDTTVGGTEPVTTSPPATTTTTTTTVAPTTTIAPTTTTTVAPTTTLDPIEELAAAVKQARLDGEAAINAAGLDPTNEALREAVAQYNTGPRLEETTAFLDQLAADGLAFRQDEQNPSFIEFEGSIELPEGLNSTEAFLTECRVDTDVVYVVQDNPEAPEIVVDDAVVAVRARVRYVLEAGIWKNHSGDLISQTKGVESCD